MLVIGNNRGPHRWGALTHSYLNLSCYLSMLPTPASVGPCCSSPLPWLSTWFWLISDVVDIGICNVTCLCWASSDGGVGCGLIERDGGGWVFTIAVMTTSGLLSR